jgi:hypothetical protein
LIPRRRERGSALIAVLVVLALVVTAFAVAAPAGVAAMRRAEAAKTRSDEKWIARSRAATGLDYFTKLLRSTYDADMSAGRAILRDKVLPAFDDQGVPAQSSLPVIVAAADGSSHPSGCESTPQGCTSILGNVDTYIHARAGLINPDFFTSSSVPAGTLKIADIRVAERRVMSRGGEAAYRVEYLLDARGGDNGRTRDRGEVMFGVNDVTCGTSVYAPVAEQTIIRGQTATFQVNYVRARQLVLSAGTTVVETRPVTDSLNTQSASFSVAPTSDTTYTVEADGPGACTATTTYVVHVQAPICPVAQLFDVSPASLIGPGTVNVQWQVGGPPYEVRLNGSVVSASGSLSATVNADTTFTLTARDLTNQCPITLTKTVHVSACPALTAFSADRTTITRGDPPVVLTWQIDNPAPGARYLLNGVDVPAAGSQPVSPNTTADYTLSLVPPPGSSCPPAQRTIRITVNDRPCPVLDLFEPSASSLVEGSTLVINWRVLQANSATTIHLTGGGLDQLVAPQDSRSLTLAPGTYTFRLDVTSSYPECPGTQTKQFSVTVTPKPPVCDAVIHSFDTTTPCVSAGAQVPFSWNVTASAPCVVQINGVGSYPLVGSASFAVNSPQTFTLSATSVNCPAQTLSRFVDVAQPAPVITTLSSSPSTTPRQGDVVTISYGASGGTSATINGSTVDPNGNPVSPSGGSFTYAANAPADFTYAVTSSGCSPKAATATIQIRPVPCPVPSVQFFRANPPNVSTGAPTVFEWSVANTEAGASVTITGPGVNMAGLPASGSASATMPTTPGTYYFTITVSNPCNPANTVSVQTAVNVTCPAPRVTGFSVSPNNYAAGTNSFITFNWTTSDSSGGPVTVDISSVGGGLPANGPVDASAPATEGTYTYTIVARNGCGGVSQPVSVTVTVTAKPCPPPVINSFTASPNSVLSGGGQTVRLTWSISDSSGSPLSITIPGVGTFTSSNSFIDIPQPQATTTYTLNVSNGCGASVSAQVTVTVGSCPSPAINSFAASPNGVTAGGNQTVRLSWDVSDGSGLGVTVSIPGVGSWNAASGFVDIPQPQATTTYTLNVSNGCGASVSAQVTVTVGSCPPPSVNSFSATPSSVVAGGNQTVRLSWDVSDASGFGVTVTIPGVGTWNAASGFVDIPQPQSTTTYALSVTNGCGASASAQAAINVTSGPSKTGPLAVNGRESCQSLGLSPPGCLDFHATVSASLTSDGDGNYTAVVRNTSDVLGTPYYRDLALAPGIAILGAPNSAGFFPPPCCALGYNTENRAMLAHYEPGSFNNFGINFVGLTAFNEATFTFTLPPGASQVVLEGLPSPYTIDTGDGRGPMPYFYEFAGRDQNLFGEINRNYDLVFNVP